MDYSDLYEMVQLEQENTTQCAVYDKTPGSEQKKINIVVRNTYTVRKVIADITTQYRYDAFDLVLQPISQEDLVFLNDRPEVLIFQVPGFEAHLRNTLILLPSGEWDGNVKQRFDLSMTPLKSVVYINGKHNSSNNNISIASNSISNGSSGGGGGDSCGGFGEESASSSKTKSPVDTVIAMTSIVTSDSTSAPNTRSATNSLNLSPMSDPDQLSDDDLALGASASPTETEPPMHAISCGGNGGNTSPNSSSRGGGSSCVPYGPINKDELYQDIRGITSHEHHDDSHHDRNYRLAALPPCATTNAAASALMMMSSASSVSANAASAYVGLVNQAMTCYLNSLLQALYMTPEFRNALYRWEFDNDNEAKNIPYQLQKLFLNLQTSKKSAVETTDLTRSFGWDSTEAWQQHDIQELCRVMFDALEHKFKNTKQAHLISNLYEGKMIDYVKCLECNTEKTRADTFLDIPLPVRPFGSQVAYGSIEEALRAFVQPETLDGNNQYFCEKCNKKCDAHKGLKFKNFPYVLTLHLKRFDFDYSTMHRIKLNDKVTFPQTLNLNTFVNATDAQTFTNLPQQQQNGNAEAATTTSTGLLNGAAAAAAAATVTSTTTSPNSNTDDCSTTDSGSAMEEDQCSSGIATTASSSQHEGDMNDEDEGIDMSTSTNAAGQRAKHESGPFLYELFAIMIHSGSASGGHYYAYIKEFENNEWFCFNDQSVSPITQEDIQKSFGGSATKAYYSSVYSSSTNAYMLMYRQIDPKHNEHVMHAPDFPDHIAALLPILHSEEETRGGSRGGSGHHRHIASSSVADLTLPELIKPRVYFYNPTLKKLKVTRVYCSRSFDVNSVLESAYQMLDVEQFAPLSRCRLVGYDSTSEEILQSFEDVADPALADIRASCDGPLDFLLEYRIEGQQFEAYAIGGATWNVFMVNLATMEMDGPYFVHSAAHENGDVLQHSIAARLHVKETELLLATVPSKKAFVAYDPTPTREAQQHLQSVAKSQFRNISYFYLNVPSTDTSNLEILGIPAYETAVTPTPAIEVSADVVDAVVMNGSGAPAAHTQKAVTTASTTTVGSDLHNGCLSSTSVNESNSEDSSLSDGDRTLVESLQNRGGSGGGGGGGGAGDSQISSNSYSPQMLSSPEDDCESGLVAAASFLTTSSASAINTTNNISTALLYCGPDDIFVAPLQPTLPQFFHAIKIDCVDAIANSTAANSDDEATSRKPATAYKILVVTHMKMDEFKRRIAALIRVPATHFKIQRKHDSTDPINSSAHSLYFLTEGETLLVELGKVLQPDEHRAKIYYMRLSELDDAGKLPCVCEWIYNASTQRMGDAKRQLIAQLKRIDPQKYRTLSVENCRLWLKGGRNPIKILADDDTLEGRASTVPAEILVQECENGVNPQTSEDSLTIFVRRWHADKLQLDKFQEITLEKDSEIRNVLATITDLREELIAYSKINNSFPCTNISLLSVNGSMSWFSIPATLDKYPLLNTINGNVYFYKDVSKAPKELTSEERRELSAKEKTRLDRLGLSTSLYSPRRERALKIYLDSSPQTTTTASAPMDASSAKAGAD